MTNYYLKSNNVITQSANFKFDKNCLETEEEIVLVSFGGSISDIKMLKSDYDVYIQSPEYISQQKKQLIQTAKQIRDTAINEITNAKLLDDLQLDAGIIIEAIHTARKTARLAQLAEVNTTFYTTTGLTQPTTIIA